MDAPKYPPLQVLRSFDPPPESAGKRGRPLSDLTRVMRMLKEGESVKVNRPVDEARRWVYKYRRRHGRLLFFVVRKLAGKPGWSQIWRMQDYSGPPENKALRKIRMLL